jgi:alpha-beta hydrolase superfamily lysophospholipase
MRFSPKKPKRRCLRKLGLLVLALFVLLNIVSFFHAYNFTHVVPEGAGTPPPENLSVAQKVKVLFTGVTVSKIGNKRTPKDFDLSFEAKVIEHDGGKFSTPAWEIKTESATRTALMVHAYHSRREQLLPLAQFFASLGCDVVLVDLPGHGDSGENWTTLGYREADVVRDVFEHYRTASSRPIIIYGQSLGAAAALGAVSRHKIAPDGMILEMPYGSLVGTVRRRFELMGFPFSFPFAETMVFWGGVQHGYNAFKLAPVEYAKDVTAPVLLLGGGRDPRVTRETLEEMHRNLGGKKRLHHFEERVHEAFFESDTETYRELVKKFLEEDCTLTSDR